MITIPIGSRISFPWNGNRRQQGLVIAVTAHVRDITIRNRKAFANKWYYVVRVDARYKENWHGFIDDRIRHIPAWKNDLRLLRGGAK